MSGKKKRQANAVSGQESPDSLTGAERLIQVARQDRIRKCGEEINAALEMHGCLIVPVVILRGTQVQSEVQIVAK